MNQPKPAHLPSRKKPSRVTGTPKPQILLFGDSHSYAVQRAIEKRIGKGRSAPLVVHRLLKEKNDRPIGDTSLEAFLRMIRQLDSDDVVLSMIGGNQHAVFGTIRHPQPFDFFDLGIAMSRSDAAELIPYRVLADLFAEGIRNSDGKSITALRKATQARVVHILPPPPKADNAFLEQHHEGYFARLGIASSGVAPPSVRLKLWSLQARLLNKLCAKLGVEVMAPPKGTADPDGFLAPAYYAKDATHANHLYGEMLLREIEARFRPLGTIS